MTRLKVTAPELTDLPGIFMNESEAAEVLQHSMDRWQHDLKSRVAEAILELARERDADPLELIKVADLLVEVKMPDKRGRSSPIDPFPTLLRVARELANGKSQRVACELAGVSEPTFRKLKDDRKNLWPMIKDSARKFPDLVETHLRDMLHRK